MDQSNQRQLQERKERHFEVEVDYTRRILASPKNSPERARLFQEGYDAVTRLIADYNPGGGETHYTDVVAAIVERRVPKGAEVFDLGCASGNLLVELARRGFRISGIDVSGELVRQARTKLQDCGFADRVSRSDVMEYAHSAPVDCIVMDNVIEHFHPDSVGDVLRKCHAMLKPGGQVVVLTPHRLSGPHDITREFRPLGTPAQGLHLKEFTFTDLDDELRLAGFRSVMGFPFHPRLLRKIRFVPDCSEWAAKKSIALEKLFTRHRSLSSLMTRSATAGHLCVALLFPSICVAQK